MISGAQQRPFFNLTTPGRVPFVANPAQPHQLAASAGLMFDAATNCLTVTGNTFTPHLMVNQAGSTGVLALRSDSPSGFSNLDFNGSDGVNKGFVGYGNASSGFHPSSLQFFSRAGVNLLMGGALQMQMAMNGSAVMLHTQTDAANGRVQLATHTTAAGGYGFFDFSLYRSGANRLATNAANFDANAINCGILSASVVNSGGPINAAAAGYTCDGSTVVTTRKTGWGVPTGTSDRSAFDTGTVTLPQLAERVRALIHDLHAATLGHGLIGP